MRNKGEAGEKESKRSKSLPHFRGDSVAFGGGTVTPVGLVSASPRDSMSKETWEGSPSPQHTLPRCTLHLSRTSAVATEGLQYWWNSWLVSTLVHFTLCQKQQCRRVKQNSRRGLVSTKHAQIWGKVVRWIQIEIYLFISHDVVGEAIYPQHASIPHNLFQKIDWMQFNSVLEHSFILNSVLVIWRLTD